MDEIFRFSADENDAGVRIDKLVSERIENVTRTGAQTLIDGGSVTVNGRTCAKNYRVSVGDAVKITVPEPKELNVEAENIPLDIVYEDADLLVVNKPKGMVVHPAPGNYEGTLVNALMYHCKGELSGINGVLRPGIVHRIDKDTSGLLIVAKSDRAHLGLAEQIKVHSFKREYEAVVYGNLKNDSFTVDLPIGRNPNDRKQMTVTAKNSKEAITHCEVVERFDGFTHVKLTLETGRTHQIRVHMAHIGHPVAGDPVYGPKKVITSLKGQCLHARTIGFVHPITGEYLQFSSDLPGYFLDFINSLRR